MIPTKTLRQRIDDALEPFLADPDLSTDDAVQAVIDAIGDPCLIKTADSLEPTFTLRAQDKSASRCVCYWADLNRSTLAKRKHAEAIECAVAMERWPTRKWPD